MIKLFRRIRFEFMENNKTGKYLKYAIGEIVLVVVGILIALQLNAWNDYSKDRTIEKKVLLNLRYDLQKDTTDLNNLLRLKKDQLQKCHRMLDAFNNPNREILDSLQFINNIKYSFYFYVDNPHRTAFDLGKSSGDLFKITNDTLLKKISVYFSNNNTTQFLATNKKFSNEFMSDVYLQHHNLNFQNFNVFKEGVLKDFKISNYFSVMLEYLSISIDLITEKKNSALELMADIDKH
ncbi:DUF6090 family protein [Aegicerativicinus sediminis]|uniref:DUF6090 family protein n=1 Tax=Aegicerativicinus sediminis TaxID=2893202 RepID=UPI001E4470E9|nr:DUF6090 family protein [Aegicerativicinus sediminis]